MPTLRLLFILFLLVPLLEIYLLVQVGAVIGAMPTVLLVVGTALLGALLLRYQGIATVLRVRQSLARGELPAMALLEGAVLLVAGALLLTPGFFTDAIGFVCLVPRLRRGLIGVLLSRYLATHPLRWGPGRPERGPRTIDGESRRED
jgi:UPF0716 protein FxsA